MRTHRLGDLQFAILSMLWQHREATVAEVHAAVGQERELALTTIGTMLRKMEARGLVAHRTEGRLFIYRPAVAEHEVSRSMVTDVVERLFDGNTTELVSRLLREGEFAPQELSQLRSLIEQREAELRQSKTKSRRSGDSEASRG